MADYSYMARNNAGGSVKGSLKAVSEQEVISTLRQMQLTPVKISLLQDISLAKKPVSRVVKVKKVKTTDLIVFCINLSGMMSAGITLSGALVVISEQLTNPYFAGVIRMVGKDLSDGVAFSDALEKFPRVFSKFFVNMVRVGELSGTMDNVLKTMAVYLEREENIRQTVRGALIYPMILVFAGTAVIILIVTFVLPQFVQIFEKANVPLPWMTRVLYRLSLWMRQYSWVLSICFWGLFLGGRKFLQTKIGSGLWQRLLLKIPMVGPVVCNMLVARFCRTLSVMLNAGVPLLQSLTILKEVLGNIVFAQIVQDVYNSVEKGEGISKSLIEWREFPKDVVYMISVGETSGAIGSMLAKSADFYESKVEFSIKGLLVYIEPVFISILGACVGCILASVLLPMFDMVKTIQH